MRTTASIGHFWRRSDATFANARDAVAARSRRDGVTR
jgi:hypothetical protein